jgi:hypothetical protein
LFQVLRGQPLIFFGLLIVELALVIGLSWGIKRMTTTALQQGNEDIEARLGILGVLSLYLDFVNLFLFLLRLGGRRRRPAPHISEILKTAVHFMWTAVLFGQLIPVFNTCLIHL